MTGCALLLFHITRRILHCQLLSTPSVDFRRVCERESYLATRSFFLRFFFTWWHRRAKKTRIIVPVSIEIRSIDVQTCLFKMAACKWDKCWTTKIRGERVTKRVWLSRVNDTYYWALPFQSKAFNGWKVGGHLRSGVLVTVHARRCAGFSSFPYFSGIRNVFLVHGKSGRSGDSKNRESSSRKKRLSRLWFGVQSRRRFLDGSRSEGCGSRHHGSKNQCKEFHGKGTRTVKNRGKRVGMNNRYRNVRFIWVSFQLDEIYRTWSRRSSFPGPWLLTI